MPNPFQEDIFDGKVAFITGGTSGICLRIAERFAGQGATVVLNGRNVDKMNAAVESIRAKGHRAAGFAADVRSYADIEAALAKTHEQFGAIDFVVAGAAGNFPAPVLGMSANGFKAVIDIDLLGTFNLCRAAHAFLHKPGASIIAISANHADIAYPMQAHVCAAKAGIEMLCKTLAQEWGPEGVRVNCIQPGPIDDTEGMRRLAPTEEIRRRVASGVPLQRMGTKDDVANVAIFLCSEAASYVTGGTFRCDGGSGLRGPRLLDSDSA